MNWQGHTRQTVHDAATGFYAELAMPEPMISDESARLWAVIHDALAMHSYRSLIPYFL